jgi:uncharacterized protein
LPREAGGCGVGAARAVKPSLAADLLPTVVVLRDQTVALAGVLGGLSGGFAGLPGVSVTIWRSRRGWDRHQQRAIYQPYILAMQLLAIACLGRQTPPSAPAAQDLAFVPFALFGASGGLALYQRLNKAQFHVATSALLLVSGAGLLARTL